MKTVATSTIDLTIGAIVRHPCRGVGTIVTIINNPLTHRPYKTWVEFTGIGFGLCTQKFCCFVEDLTLVPAGSPTRPVLRAVTAEPVSAA